MITAALGILTASVLGSVHCAAMCGGFACLYADPSRTTLRSHSLYNIGRLASYLMLGALAGALGAGITRLGALAGIGRAATIVAGVLMIGWGVSRLAVEFGARTKARANGGPLIWQQFIGRLLHHTRDLSVPTRALLTGMGTTLLPCGWLYVFVAAAAGTGGALRGMTLMAVFWLGTVPALLAVSMGAQRFFGPLRQRLPILGAMTVLLMGVLAVGGRLTMSTHSIAAPSHTMSHDH